MKLIVGLGNPEKKFESTRHNVGFFVLDVVAKEQGAEWQHKDKFKAFVAELPDKSALLVKPTTIQVHQSNSASGKKINRATFSRTHVLPQPYFVHHVRHYAHAQQWIAPQLCRESR